MPWDMPVNGTIDSVVSVFTYVDTVSSGIFGILFMITFSTILFVSLKARNDIQTALLTTGFIQLVVGATFFAAGIVSTSTIIVCGILFGFAVLGAYFTK